MLMMMMMMILNESAGDYFQHEQVFLSVLLFLSVDDKPTNIIRFDSHIVVL